MKQLLFSFAIAVSLIACKNGDKKHDNHEHGGGTPVTLEDSLKKSIDDDHIVGMSKMSKLSAMQDQVQQVLDSVGKLPSKAQQAAAPYVAKLNETLKELQSAKDGMNKWMEEFNMDSALNNMQVRLKYFTDEKLRIANVKESILHSLQQADSLIKAKL